MLFEGKQMLRMVAHGLRDFATAITTRSEPIARQASRRAWGPWVYLSVAATGVISALAGLEIEARWSDHAYADQVYWPIVLFAVVGAWRVRSVLFGGRDTMPREVETTEAQAIFRGLALPLVIGSTALVVVLWLEAHGSQLREGPGTWIEGVRRLITDGWYETLPTMAAGLQQWLGLSAVVAVAVAITSARRGWIKPAIEILVGVFVFGILADVALILLDAVPFSSLTGYLVQTFVAGAFDAPMRAFIDDMAVHGFFILVYTAIIGGAWWAANQNMDDLLRDGEVDLLKALQALLLPESEKKKQKKEQKKRGKKDQALLDDALPPPPPLPTFQEPPTVLPPLPDDPVGDSMSPQEDKTGRTPPTT